MLAVVVIIAIGAFLTAHGLGILAWVAGAVAGLAYLRWDVRRHPRVSCRMCGGSGDHHSRIGGENIRRPYGDCWCCGGRKSHPRFAARLLDPDGYRDEKARIERGRSKI